MGKRMLLLLLSIPFLVFSDMKDMLLNYGFERVRLTNAGKSRIIDFIKANEFDSLQVVVNFCDSINSPNLEWLSNSERFFIEVIKENWSLLKKDSFYISSFHLLDTANKEMDYPNYYFNDFGGDRYTRRYFDGGECLSNPSPVPENENLFRFLRLTYSEKLVSLRVKMPQDSYLWNFLDLLFPLNQQEMRDGRNLAAKKYLLKYPKSPFYKTVLYNFYFNFKSSGNGAIIGVGGGYQTFDSRTLKLFQEHGNLNGYLDIYIRNIPFKLGLSLIPQTLNSDLIYGRDTVPPQTQILNLNWLLGSGYLFHLNDQLHLTPYCGLAILSTSISDSTKKKLNADPKIPLIYGFQIGTTLDFQFKPPFNDARGYRFSETSLMGCRVEAGMIFYNYSRLRNDLGGISIFANVGLDFLGFGRERIFEIRKGKKEQ
jgi:hypothetical protein